MTSKKPWGRKPEVHGTGQGEGLPSCLCTKLDKAQIRDKTWRLWSDTQWAFNTALFLRFTTLYKHPFKLVTRHSICRDSLLFNAHSGFPWLLTSSVADLNCFPVGWARTSSLRVWDLRCHGLVRLQSLKCPCTIITRCVPRTASLLPSIQS